MHVSIRCQRIGELGHSGGHGERLRIRVGRGERDSRGLCREYQSPEGILSLEGGERIISMLDPLCCTKRTHHFKVVGLSHGVRRIGFLGVSPCPHVYLVFCDSGVRARLESGRVIARHVEEPLVIEAINPGLGVGLCTLDRTNVV